MSYWPFPVEAAFDITTWNEAGGGEPRGDTAVSYLHGSGSYLYRGVGLLLISIRGTNRKP